MTALWGCLVLVLVFASLHQRSGAVSQRDVDRVFLTYNRDSDKCKGITDSSSRDDKKTADDACQQAFFALDRIKQNTCQNWRDARCRLISGQTNRQCSCLVSYYNDSNFIATPFRECAKNIASAEPSTRVELAQSKNKRKSTHDDAQKPAKKRFASINSEHYGGVGTSFSPYSSSGADSSQDWHIGSSASTSGSVPTSGSAAPRGRPRQTGQADAPRPYPCTVCTNSYRNQFGLNLHMKTHKSNEARCPVCYAPFSLRSNLTYHIKREHPGTPLPEKSRRTAAERGESKLHNCPHCPRGYVYERTLREHLKSHETDETTCPVCGKWFAIMPNLRIHIEKTHPGTPIPERVQPKPKDSGPFICKECKTEYGTKKALRAHEASHKTFDTHCFECKKTCTTRASYIRHLKKQHPEEALAVEEARKLRYIEENPEVCGVCNKRFKNADCLRAHRQVHEGKTECDICGQVFTRVTTLNRHKAEAHSDE